MKADVTGLSGMAVMFAAALAVGVPPTGDREVDASAPAQLALQIADFAAAPITGLPDGTGNNAGSLARINVLREEPARTRRFS